MISQIHITDGFDPQDMNDIQTWADVNLIGANEEWTFTNTVSGVEESINIGVPSGDTATVDWGDGTVDNQVSTGEEFMTFLHTYATTGNTIAISSTGLPSSITYLNILTKVSGTSPNLSANVNLTKFFTYYPTEISGTIFLPSGPSSITKLNVANNLYSGVIPDVSNHTGIVQFEGNNNQWTSYAGGAITATTVNFSNNLLPEAEVDRIIQGVVDGGSVNGQLQLQENAIPSAAGQANVDILATRGWSVTVDSVASPDNILFQANFENTTLDISNPEGHQIFNGDTIDGVYYEFPYDLVGMGLDLSSGLYDYFHYIAPDADLTDPIDYEQYVITRMDSGLTIPDTATTTALYQEYITKAGSTTRNQYSQKADPSGDIYQSFNQLYIKHKKYIHCNGVNWAQDNWNLPFEWKQENNNAGRFGLYINDIVSGTPYWYLKAEQMIDGSPGPDYWTRTSAAVVPLDEWFDIEIFFIGSGDPAIGRVQVAVNGVIIFDVTDQTKHTGTDSSPYYSSNGLKVYGADGYMLTTDIIMAKEPIVASILPGSGA